MPLLAEAVVLFAHAPDEYYVIESSNPKVSGYDGAVRSFVDYLYELAGIV
jgi:hypothetical protein